MMLEKFIQYAQDVRIEGMQLMFGDNSDEFQSSRDALKDFVSYFRHLRNKREASKEELNLLGFLTHMLNSTNFCKH